MLFVAATDGTYLRNKLPCEIQPVDRVHDARRAGV